MIGSFGREAVSEPERLLDVLERAQPRAREEQQLVARDTERIEQPSRLVVVGRAAAPTPRTRTRAGSAS